MNEKIIAHMYTYTELIMYREKFRVNFMSPILMNRGAKPHL